MTLIIEAAQTFSPGNVELLVCLLKKISSKNINIIVYLGHEKTYSFINDLDFTNVTLIKTNVRDTFLRSLKKRHNVIFFCSYPPLSLHSNSIVYFHSSFFTNPKTFLFDKKVIMSSKLRRIFIHTIIKLFHRNVDYFICQTNQIEEDLKKNFTGIKVKKMPFYNDTDLIGLNHKVFSSFDYDFFYPATPDVHKNYFRLLDAVLILSKKRKVSICVTIDPSATKYQQRIDEVNNLIGYHAITNVGRVSKKTVLELYMKSKAMIFPSLEESLGLPLIEAAYISCPIVGSDLPYMYDVVENPIVFNPFDVQDMANKMNGFLEGKYVNNNQKNKIENKVEEIINFFE